MNPLPPVSTQRWPNLPVAKLQKPHASPYPALRFPGYECAPVSGAITAARSWARGKWVLKSNGTENSLKLEKPFFMVAWTEGRPCGNRSALEPKCSLIHLALISAAGFAGPRSTSTSPSNLHASCLMIRHCFRNGNLPTSAVSRCRPLSRS